LYRTQDFNIRKGLEYLAGVLKETNDNIFEAMGKYNGWYRGLTKVFIYFF